jgi:hypothetical protein
MDNDKHLCRGEAFGQKTSIFSDNLVPECFALTRRIGQKTSMFSDNFLPEAFAQIR